jgi:hypothetical protein
MWEFEVNPIRNKKLNKKYEFLGKKSKFKGDIILEIVLLEYWTFSQMLSDNKKHNYIWSLK